MSTKTIARYLGMLALLLAQPMTAGAGTGHDLTNQKWRPIEISGKSIAGENKAYIQFRPDGAATGHGSCNQMGASYTADKTNLRLGPMRSTRRGCAPDIMQIESAFTGALEATRLYLRNSNKLTLKNAQGVTTMRLIASQ